MVLTPHLMEKRVKVFIEKTITALKALIALLELIRQFIN
ncbi:damage-inducible type I toxin DinQ [Klebsiella aerogenes]